MKQKVTLRVGDVPLTDDHANNATPRAAAHEAGDSR